MMSADYLGLLAIESDQKQVRTSNETNPEDNWWEVGEGKKGKSKLYFFT